MLGDWSKVIYMLDVKKIKRDFPILSREINSKTLHYLDNAATSHKPFRVVSAMQEFYTVHNSNVHRGLHTLSEEATDLYEKARKAVADFIGARFSEEVIFTSGATDSLNMVSRMLCQGILRANDEILVTDHEHHSNFVPWQQYAKQYGLKFRVGELSTGNPEELISLLKTSMNPKVKVVSIAHAGNVTGTIFPIKEAAEVVHSYGSYLSIDGAQAIPHMKVNVSDLGCDFYSFSSHKMLGPMGIGVLWIRKDIMSKLIPPLYGGGMIDEVSAFETTWAEPPDKYEAGTPNVAGAVGLAEAIGYLSMIGMENIRKHEMSINLFLLQELNKIPGLEVIGGLSAEERTGVVSFVIENIHAHDLSALFNTEGVAVRSGHHCAMPLHRKLGIPASTRASHYLYNDRDDVEALIRAIHKACRIFR